MAVVIDLDALRRRVEAEGVRDAREQLLLRRALGELARQRLARIDQGVLDELALVAALRRRELDPAPGMGRERLDQQIVVGRHVAREDAGRDRLVVVELADEGGEHVLDAELPVVAREIGAVAPVLAAAEEEHLDRGVAAGLVRGDDIGIAQPFDIDVLPSLDLRQGADAVAQQGRALEFEPLG